MTRKRLLLAFGVLLVLCCAGSALVVVLSPKETEVPLAQASKTPTAEIPAPTKVFTVSAVRATPTPAPVPTNTLPPTLTPIPTSPPTLTPEPTSTTTPAPTPTQISKEDFTASVTNLAYADADRSDRYIGERVCWKGQVFRIEESEGNTVFQSWYFEGRHRAFEDLDAFIVFYADLLPDVNEDTEVMVCGQLGEKFEGTNVLGGTIRQPLIYAVYVDLWVPTALPTATPAPTPTPLPRSNDFGIQKQVGSWGMKLYDVKRAKAVYFYEDAEIAQGVWLMPFVEFTNLGSGTRSPWEDLDFYLKDDQGRTYDAGYSDGNLGAGWQFQAGDIMDDINPGLVLGVVLPVDVPESLGDVWLMVEQDPSFAAYLGNASAVPLEE
jgi:hypothetical protein